MDESNNGRSLATGLSKQRKTEGNEYNPLRLKAMSWRGWLVSLRTLPAESVLEEGQEGVRTVAPHVT